MWLRILSIPPNDKTCNRLVANPIDSPQKLTHKSGKEILNVDKNCVNGNIHQVVGKVSFFRRRASPTMYLRTNVKRQVCEVSRCSSEQKEMDRT